jgi:hypothetical protein
MWSIIGGYHKVLLRPIREEVAFKWPHTAAMPPKNSHVHLPSVSVNTPATVVPVLNQATCHKRVRGSGDMAPLILNFGSI